MLFSVPTPTEHLYNSCITVFVYSKLQKVLVSSPNAGMLLWDLKWQY